MTASSLKIESLSARGFPVVDADVAARRSRCAPRAAVIAAGTTAREHADARCPISGAMPGTRCTSQPSSVYRDAGAEAQDSTFSNKVYDIH
jgi:hypothetical protein